MYHYNKGLVKSRLNKVDEAIQSYTKATNLIDASDTDYMYQAYFNLGICDRRNGDLESSIKHLKKAI